MKKEKRIKKALERINPGRKIDLEKICPLIGKECIMYKCNAYTPNKDINYVSQDEVYKYLDDGHTDWKETIEKDGWRLDQMIQTPRLNTLDETDYIFTKDTSIGYSNTIGRCTWGCK